MSRLRTRDRDELELRRRRDTLRRDDLQREELRRAEFDDDLRRRELRREQLLDETLSGDASADTAAGVDTLDAVDRTDIVGAWAVGPIVAALSGAVMLLWGLIVIARAGLGEPIDEPVVEVAGLRATALLGIIVGAAGLVLILTAATAARMAVLAVAVIIGVAAAVLTIEPTVEEQWLAGERTLGVFVLVLMALTAAAALVPGRRTVSRRRRAALR